MLVDTHCHILKEDYDNIDEIVNNLEVKAIVSGYDNRTNLEVIDLINKHNNLYATIGIHPSEVDKMENEDLKILEDNLSRPKVVGIGEIGLDYHYSKENMEKQKEIFIKQLDLARKYKMPVVIHSRDAALDTLEIVKMYKDLKITYHCYSYSLEIAKELEKQGVKFGIGGVLTFKNSKVLKEVVRNLKPESLLLETDSPYLTPEPFRGQKNNPNNIKIVASKIAEIKETSLENIEKITTENAIYQFDLSI